MVFKLGSRYHRISQDGLTPRVSLLRRTVLQRVKGLRTRCIANGFFLIITVFTLRALIQAYGFILGLLQGRIFAPGFGQMHIR